MVIDTIIIHSMHNPNAVNCFSPESCKEILDEFGVSAHYLIDLAGVVWRLVPEEKMAWHAGVSKMPGADLRERVNDFSIGIELIGDEETPFTDAQYQTLAVLLRDIASRHPISNILGHTDIAPDRKTDPWGLDWERVQLDFQLGAGETVVQFPTIT
jgi:AmpD protein